MEEVSWFIGARIARDVIGNIHWFVESSDGLSHGNLVDEGSPRDLLQAMHAVDRAVIDELYRLYTSRIEQLRMI